MGLINSPENGATERPGTSNDTSLFVFLAGPIRTWWSPEHEETPAHFRYLKARDEIHAALSEEFLVYAPHRAWRGPWNDLAQEVNDHAIKLSHAFVWLDVYDENGNAMPAEGTMKELALAIYKLKEPFRIPISYDESYKPRLKEVIVFLKELNKKRLASNEQN